MVAGRRGSPPDKGVVDAARIRDDDWPREWGLPRTADRLMTPTAQIARWGSFAHWASMTMPTALREGDHVARDA
jgi:hypothetical protein